MLNPKHSIISTLVLQLTRRSQVINSTHSLEMQRGEDMAKNSKSNKLKHKMFVKGVGLAGDKTISTTSGVRTFGLFAKLFKRFDKKESHIMARNKTYGAMKRNPKMKPEDSSNLYYKSRRQEGIKKGIFRGGIITQLFKKRK